jgi:hypothetical protein
MRPLDRKLVDEPDPESDSVPVQLRHTWVHKLGIFLFIIVCFEVGAFLAVFPWTPQWDTNSLAGLFPWLRELWTNSYFRGALSGLGLLNIYISLGEVSRLRRPRADRLKVSTL